MSLWVIVIMGLIAGNTGKAAATGVEGVLVGAMVNKFTKYPPKCILYKAFSIGSNSDKLIGTHIYILIRIVLNGKLPVPNPTYCK